MFSCLQHTREGHMLDACPTKGHDDCHAAADDDDDDGTGASLL